MFPKPVQALSSAGTEPEVATRCREPALSSKMDMKPEGGRRLCSRHRRLPRAPVASASGDALGRTKRVVLPGATLSAAALFPSPMQKKRRKKEKQIGRASLPTGCAALPCPSAVGLEADGEECWESEGGKISIHRRPRRRRRRRCYWNDRSEINGSVIHP